MNANDKILNGDVLIIDDILPKSIYNTLKSILYDNNFNWRAAKNTALVTDFMIPGFDNGVSFSQNLFDVVSPGENNDNARINPFFISAFMIASESAEITFDRLFRIRAGLIVNTVSEHKFHYPHIDATSETISGVLYFTNCDAPLKIYNEVYDESFNGTGKDPAEGTMLCLQRKYNSSLTTKIEIPCRENRMVFFNGRSYHSSSIPTDTSMRIATNFNFI